MTDIPANKSSKTEAESKCPNRACVKGKNVGETGKFSVDS